jgi:excisionase family DNA binding protein
MGVPGLVGAASHRHFWVLSEGIAAGHSVARGRRARNADSLDVNAQTEGVKARRLENVSSDSGHGRFYTPRDVADRFSVSVRTVYAWCDQGLLPCHQIGPRLKRISDADIAVFLSSGKEEG